MVDYCNIIIQAAHLIYKTEKTFLKLKLRLCEHANKVCFQWAVLGSLYHFQDQNSLSLGIGAPQGPNRTALPLLCVWCLIRTEEMCGHETSERIVFQRAPSAEVEQTGF